MLPSFLENLAPEVYHGDNYVVLDFETDTSHGDYGDAVHPDNGLVLACWRYRGTMHAKWGSEFEMGLLVEHIQQADFLVAHNAKYELKWLERCGLDLSQVLVFDTMLGEYVLLGNLAVRSEEGHWKMRSTSLDQCCRRRGWPIKNPVVDVMISNGINPISIPRPWLRQLCMQDVESTEKLVQDQLERLSASNRLAVAYTRNLLTPVLTDIELEGMALDPARVAEEFEKYAHRQMELQLEMDQLTGGINWRSPAQVATFIYDELGFQELRNRKGEPIRNKASKAFPNGAPKTDKDTLDKLAAKTPEQKEFIRIRKEIGKVSAALSKNLQFFKGVCLELGGVFKATFNQANTATHRLSSSGIPTYFKLFDKEKTVQFQNMARIFKRLFKAKREGYLIGEADGSQLEFRAAAHLGKCEKAKELILDPDGDVHSLSTMIQYSLNQDELALLKEEKPKQFKDKRTNSKSWTFQPLYGGEGKSKKQKDYAKAFREAYPGISQEQKRWTWEVNEKKSLITPWGLRYYWPRAHMRRDGTLNCKTSVYNYPVQAFATAEIIPIAVVYMYYRIREAGLQDKIVIVNTVHDSVICEIHPDYVEQFEEIAKQAFTMDVYNYLEVVYNISFDFVPLGVGITVGDHWNEGQEKAFNIYRDGTVERTA